MGHPLTVHILRHGRVSEMMCEVFQDAGQSSPHKRPLSGRLQGQTQSPLPQRGGCTHELRTGSWGTEMRSFYNLFPLSPCTSPYSSAPSFVALTSSSSSDRICLSMDCANRQCWASFSAVRQKRGGFQVEEAPGSSVLCPFFVDSDGGRAAPQESFGEEELPVLVPLELSFPKDKILSYKII